MEIWTEKYRPEHLEEMAGQQDVVNRMKAILKTKNVPHFLFAGPAGTGKTTMALIIARNLFGDAWGQNFLELNASDERGIDTIRNKVKNFARTKPIGDVPFKIILLDEADSLTKEAQQALRRTMENYTRTCRFILDCNYVSKIIDPIQSRCTVFRFKPLSFDEMRPYLERIAKAEKLDISADAYKAIYEVSEGDCRRAVNVLQSCSSAKKVTENVVYQTASQASAKEIQSVVEKAISGQFAAARTALFDMIMKYGLSGMDVVKAVNSAVMSMKIPEATRMKLVNAIGEYEFRIVEGADEHIQLSAMLAQFGILGK